MKTIQFILSLLTIAFLTSCSADSDLLNEMDNTNTSQKEELVSVTLNLTAEGVKTRSHIETGDPASPEENESKITSYAILVFGDHGFLLGSKTSEDAGNIAIESIYIGKIKRQALRVYAIANFSNSSFAAFTNENDVKSFLNVESDSYTGNGFNHANLNGAAASSLPKAGYASVNKNACENVTVSLVQLTARLDQPQVKVGGEKEQFTITETTLGESSKVESFPYYFYPEANLQISVSGKFTEANQSDKIYKLGTWTLGGESGCMNNTIYKLIISSSLPTDDLMGALWIDWYIVDMIIENISAEVGGKN